MSIHEPTITARPSTRPTASLVRLTMSAALVAGLTSGCLEAQDPATAVAVDPELKAILDSVSGVPVEWYADEPMPAPQPVGGADRRTGRLRLHVSGGAGHQYVTMLQNDSTGTVPAAAVGDTLLVFQRVGARQESIVGTSARPFTVVARRRFLVPDGQGGCGAPDYSGWTFLLEGDVSGMAGEYGWHAPPVALRAPITWPEQKRAPSAVRDGYRASYLSLANHATEAAIREFVKPDLPAYTAENVRAQVMGDDGLAYWDKLRIHAFRGGDGRAVGVATFSLADDPSDHGNTTKRAVILDAAGSVIAEVPTEYDILGVVDLDGDGTDEVLTTQGAIRWVGTDWEFPTHYDPVWC